MSSRWYRLEGGRVIDDEARVVGEGEQTFSKAGDVPATSNERADIIPQEIGGGGTEIDEPFSIEGQNLASDWESRTIYIDARIVEVNDEVVHLDCLLDPEERVFEERVFDRRLIEGRIPVKIGKYILIKIIQSPGQQNIIFKNDTGCVRREYFEEEPDLDEIDDDIFNSPVEI